MAAELQQLAGLGFNDGVTEGAKYDIPFEAGGCKLCSVWFTKPGALMKHHKTVWKLYLNAKPAREDSSGRMQRHAEVLGATGLGAAILVWSLR